MSADNAAGGWMDELAEIREELREIADTIPYQDVPELVEEAAGHLGMACDRIEAQSGR